MSDPFPCFLVQSKAGEIRSAVSEAAIGDLPPGDLLIEVEYSSLNYKDALACQGHKGVAPNLPHVPGIDCAGTVIKSDSPRFEVGNQVLITGYELGATRWGGFAARVSAPCEWVVPLPPELSPRDAMIYGTAGFTAAQCVMAITQRVDPTKGEILVTGATGGVGSLSVAILSKLGYEVVAVSGKPELTETLHTLGASRVLGRESLDTPQDRPLLKASFAAAIDTVGGAPLTAVIRSISHRGIVAACGLVAGDQLDLTVYPFLLRGLTLAGIDSAQCPYQDRLEIWRRLAGPWRVDLPQELVKEITLGELPERIAQILVGNASGRTLVRPDP